MTNAEFNTTLSMDEIDENFKNVDFFDGLMEGLTEALKYTKGKASAETIVRKNSLPAVNVVEIRTSLSMTQKAFATLLGVSCRTVESWETGRTNPTPTAKKLMFLISQDKSLVNRL